jgi:predicted cation transporter
MISLLGIIFLVVLALPFLFKRVEHNLEAFLFSMGVLAVTASDVWTLHLIVDALQHPIIITSAVLVAGVATHIVRNPFERAIQGLYSRIPIKLLVAVTILVLGLSSSFITAIIAGILLSEFLTLIPLSRTSRVHTAVIGCFAIGFGAALTPIGEPLSTIAIQKLAGEPHYADFFFLARLLGPEIIVGVLAATILSIFFTRTGKPSLQVPATGKDLETWAIVVTRSIRVYVFVAALTLLGAGFEVVIEKYLGQVPSYVLYWANMSSAVLDNATLTAAEMGPYLSLNQIHDALLALLISGVMLIPGNIPNIIVSNKMGISMKEWAYLGIPLGIVAMGVGFLSIMLF